MITTATFICGLVTFLLASISLKVLKDEKGNIITQNGKVLLISLVVLMLLLLSTSSFLIYTTITELLTSN